MRQNAFVFDVEDQKIGFARAKCNDEETMIISEQDYIDFGNTYGLNVTEEVCTHDKAETRTYASEHRGQVVVNPNRETAHGE